MPAEPEYHVVQLAGHYDFLAPCSDAMALIAPAICSSKPGFDRAAFHDSFNDKVVRFFNATISGDPRLR